MLRQYKFGFDWYSLILFAITMLPTFFWMAVPAQNDILRTTSITPLTDAIASVSQVTMIFTLCVFINKNVNKISITPLIVGVIICCLLYYAGWICYYSGITNALIIVLLTVPPCMSFVLCALDRKNYFALIFALVFLISHLIYGVVNYIL